MKKFGILENPGRREFLRKIGIGTLGTVATTTPGFAGWLADLLSGNLKVEKLKQDNNLTNSEKEIVGGLEKAFENNDSDSIKQIKEEYEKKEGLDKFQILLNAALASFFFVRVIPLFLKSETAKAFIESIPAVGLWFSFSNHETKKEFEEEMKEGAKGTAIMSAITMLSEGINIDIEQLLTIKVLKKLDNDINEVLNSEDIKNVLNLLNIEVLENIEILMDIKGLGLEDIEKLENIDEIESINKVEVVYVKNNEIKVSKNVLVNILPLLRKPTTQAEIYNFLYKYMIKKDIEEAKQILEEGIKEGERKGFISIEDETSEKIKKLEIDIILTEVNELISLTLVSQPFGGLGLVIATLFKDKVQRIGYRIKNMALGNLFDNEKANDFARMFVDNMTSFLVNKMAYLSDLGPDTAALQKGNNIINSLGTIASSAVPVAFLSAAPLLKNISKILEEITKQKIDNLGSKYFEQFFVGLNDNLKTSSNMIFDMLKTGLNTLPDDLQYVIKKQIAKIDDKEIKALKTNKPIAFSKKQMEENLDKLEDIKKDIRETMRYYFSGEKIFTDINTFFLEANGDFNAIFFSNDDENPLNGKSFVEILYMLKAIGEKKKSSLYGKFGDIFRYNVITFRKFYNVLKDFNNQEYLDKFSFLNKYINIDNKNEEKLEGSGKNEYFEYLYKHIKEGNYNALRGNGEYDIDSLLFILKENFGKVIQIKSAEKIIKIGIELLAYIDTKNDKAVFKKLSGTFVNNLIISDKNTLNFLNKSLNLDISHGVVKLALYRLYAKLSNEEKKILLKIFEEAKNNENEQIIKEYENIIKTGKSRLQDNETNLEIPDSIKEILNNNLLSEKEKIEKSLNIFQKLGKLGEEKFHYIEKLLESGIGPNAYEVVQMVLLIQTPYVVSVRKTIAQIIESLPKNTPNFIKEIIVAQGVYTISMFADNYVGLVVGVELAKDILGMDTMKAIDKYTKFAINGGSKVITGNSTNPILKGELGGNWYFIENLVPDKKQQKKLGKILNIMDTVERIDFNKTIYSKQELEEIKNKLKNIKKDIESENNKTINNILQLELDKLNKVISQNKNKTEIEYKFNEDIKYLPFMLAGVIDNDNLNILKKFTNGVFEVIMDVLILYYVPTLKEIGEGAFKKEPLLSSVAVWLLMNR